MNGFLNQSGALKDFAGTAPLFPLPDLVLFPHALMPLHIFENRYRQMISDVLKGNRLIVMTRLKEGHQDLYHTKQAPIFLTGCLGRVSAHQQLPDGRYYLIFEGIVRVQIEQEVSGNQPYRVGRLKLRRDRHRFSDHFDPEFHVRRLLEIGRNQLFEDSDLKSLMTILDTSVKLGTLCDVLSHACLLEAEQKQALLEEFNIERRYYRLIQSLEGLLRPNERNRDRILPPFSHN
jgi:uncharacterized protein